MFVYFSNSIWVFSCRCLFILTRASHTLVRGSACTLYTFDATCNFQQNAFNLLLACLFDLWNFVLHGSRCTLVGQNNKIHSNLYCGVAHLRLLATVHKYCEWRTPNQPFGYSLQICFGAAEMRCKRNYFRSNMIKRLALISGRIAWNQRKFPRRCLLAPNFHCSMRFHLH